MKAVCPGSFDPITVGHLDVIRRAARLFDSVTVLVSANSEKKYMFDESKRVALVEASCADIPNVSVELCRGWVADEAREKDAVIVKGVRNGTDCEYETGIAAVNRYASGVETLLLPAAAEVSDVSSTVVRELIKYGKDFASLVPQQALKLIKEA